MTNITIVGIDIDVSELEIKHVYHHKSESLYLFEVITNNKMLLYVVEGNELVKLTYPVTDWLQKHPEWLHHPMEVDFGDYYRIDVVRTPAKISTMVTSDVHRCSHCGSEMADMYCGECDTLDLGN